jgi:hypothetical protein
MGGWLCGEEGEAESEVEEEVILYEFRGFKVLGRVYIAGVYGLKDPNWNGAFFRNQ